MCSALSQAPAIKAVLKGLSHEIDFKNFDKNLTELGLTKGHGWFLKFLGTPDYFIMQKVYLLRLMPDCFGLIMVIYLYLSVPPITSEVQLNRAECKAACRMLLIILNLRNIGINYQVL